MSDQLSGEIVITDDIGFKAPICDAYSFRCLMDFIGSTVVNLPLKISQTNISAKQTDTNLTIFHNMYIDSQKLPEFYMKPQFEEIELCVNMRQFRSKIKNAQKRTVTLTFFNNINNEFSFYAIIVVPNQKSNGTIIIDTIHNDNNVEYEFVHYVKAQPSLIVQVSELSRVFGHVTNSKCNYAEFICYQKGILINGIIDGKLTCIQTIGRIANPYNVGNENAANQNGKEICRYNISATNIKPFYKIGNIAPQSATLQIYYDKNKPLKIVFPIGTSGYHEVYLVDINPKTMKPNVA